MPDDNGFTYRYAIRRPDGEFIRQECTPSIGWMRDALGLSARDADAPPKPQTWDSREAAESALQRFREQAATMGVTDWLGVIVQQLCTPFTFHDPAEHFADEVQQWLSGRE